MAKPGGRAFAELLSLVTDDNDRLTGEASRPVLNIEMGVSPRARDQVRVGREILIDADVDENRRTGGANQARQFFGGDRVVG